MTLILNNDDVQKALDPYECLAACEDGYRELASSHAVNRPTTQSYLPTRYPEVRTASNPLRVASENLALWPYELHLTLLKKKK